MKDILSKIIGSLDNRQDIGFSARKLTGLASIIMGAYITICKLPIDAQLHALYAWQLLALLCLGIVTIEQVIKFKNGNSTNTDKPL